MSRSADDGNGDRLAFARLFWRSVFRGPVYPRDDRERKWVVLNNLILHFRPVRLPASSLRYTHTFGLGGMSLVLFLLLAATGVLLMFVYEPSPERAYDSILALQREVFFGKLVRNIHHWSANLLIAIVFLHLLRVYFTGGFHGPRQFNWVIGLALLFCVLVSNFTGYLLPWDQLSYWAVTICTGMIGYVPLVGDRLQSVIRGGGEIGSATLINFYTLHTTVVPVALIILMAWHFWRVRKARGVVIPRAPGEEPEEKPESVLALPNLLMREFAVALILVAFVMVFSVFVDAPLDDAANPGMSPNPAKAPWYFVGFQELLFHFHGLFALLIIPLLVAAGLVLIPYLRYDRQAPGVWFASLKGRRLAVAAALTALLLTPLWIVLDEYVIDYAAWLSGLAPAIREGALPFTVLLAGFVGLYVAAKRRFAASRTEAVQAAFILVIVAFAVLTITGVWFRGAGMALVWPWNL
ncbi:MAG: cytochrome b N-terminal domain-containing protein [Gemmatimonadales bacterium]